MNNRRKIVNILEQVESWQVEDREALAKELLSNLPSTQLKPPPRDTLSKAIGLARGDGPAPTDEEVKQIIHEHRMEKYGK